MPTGSVTLKDWRAENCRYRSLPSSETMQEKSKTQNEIAFKGRFLMGDEENS